MSGELIAAGQVPFQVPNGTLGCNAFVSNQFNNSIALIERGECDFQNKIYHAQLAGAIGVIVFDKEFNSFLSTMTGTESSDIFKKIKIPSFFVSRESGLDLTDAYLNIFSETGNGLPVEITVIPNEYDSESDGFYFSDYRTLGIAFGVFMGGSVFFWIGFCVWRRHQMSLRAMALKKLRRIKYSPQAVNEHLAQMPVNPPESPSPTSNGWLEMASSAATSSGASEKVEFSPMDDAEQNNKVKMEGNHEEADRTCIQEVSVNESNSTNAVVDIEQGTIQNVSAPSTSSPTAVVVASNKNTKSNISSPFKKIWGRKKGKTEANGALFDSGNCSVCLEEFQRDEDVLVLPCRHIFHPDCVTGKFLVLLFKKTSNCAKLTHKCYSALNININRMDYWSWSMPSL